MGKFPKLLTKSKYMEGLKCLRSLWISCNDKENIPDIDMNTQHRFDEGHIVGQLAKQLYPEGVNIPESDFNKSLELSQELLQKRKPLFEAGFKFDHCYSRADILVPVGKDEWDIIEVKSSTSVKPKHLHDLSFQFHCYKGYGLKIRKIFLLYVNNQYVKQGKINPQELFVKEDIMQEVYDTMDGINKRIAIFQEIINNNEYDSLKFGEHCESPKHSPRRGLTGYFELDGSFIIHRNNLLFIECKNSAHITQEHITNFLGKIRIIENNYGIEVKKLFFSTGNRFDVWKDIEKYGGLKLFDIKEFRQGFKELSLYMNSL